VKKFKHYILEKYTFGGTAFGLASIDKTTAQDQRKANAGVSGYEGFNQRVGSSGRAYIPAYSVASRTLPAGTIVKITDRRTGEPVGKEFGNVDGIFRVDGTGGPQTRDNIDFFSGDNREMFDYFASYGTNSNNLEVEVLNMVPNSAEEQKVLANLERHERGLPPESVVQKKPDDIGGAALANLNQQVMNIMKGGMGKEQAQTALSSVLNAVKGAMPAGVRLPF
jgi:hypothetical protein